MKLVNVFKADSRNRSQLKLRRIVAAGLRAVLSMWLLLAPALSLSGLSQVKPLNSEARDGNRIKVSVLNFQDESGTGATDELGRWLGSYLAKHLTYVSKQGLSAQFFNWGNDASSIKEWPTKHLVAHGQKVSAQFVVRAGLLAAGSQSIQGRVRTRIQLYAEVVSVERRELPARRGFWFDHCLGLNRLQERRVRKLFRQKRTCRCNRAARFRDRHGDQNSLVDGGPLCSRDRPDSRQPTRTANPTFAERGQRRYELDDGSAGSFI